MIRVHLNLNINLFTNKSTRIINFSQDMIVSERQLNCNNQ
ncbi:protein of unknown function [Xenorhabdus doucetiae]|uniref:Uncharacterized protein n=1 Tax=Xenorhabdus doucetiae TaxID=351671 RepID=A0A068QTQ2_9GAMM|nr:protein of unknown function [Xenorhabdus doucetiae]